MSVVWKSRLNAGTIFLEKSIYNYLFITISFYILTIAIIPAITALHLDAISLIQASNYCWMGIRANCGKGDCDISENETAAALTFAENGPETSAAQMKMKKLSAVTFTRTPLL